MGEKERESVQRVLRPTCGPDSVGGGDLAVTERYPYKVTGMMTALQWFVRRIPLTQSVFDLQ